MGKIIYKPHCSKCGEVIDGEISYTEYTNPFDPKIREFRSFDSKISPEICVHCGEHFTHAEFVPPTKIDMSDLL